MLNFRPFRAIRNEEKKDQRRLDRARGLSHGDLLMSVGTKAAAKAKVKAEPEAKTSESQSRSSSSSSMENGTILRPRGGSKKFDTVPPHTVA